MAIFLYPGHGAVGVGSARSLPRNTRAVLPFTEAGPTMAGLSGQAYTFCTKALDTLSEKQREVVLANLLAKYAVVVRD